MKSVLIPWPEPRYREMGVYMYRGIPYTCTHPFLDTSAQAMELTQISFSRHNSATLRIQTIGGQYDRLDCCEWILAKQPDIPSSEASRIDYNSPVCVLHPQSCISTERPGPDVYSVPNITTRI